MRLVRRLHYANDELGRRTAISRSGQAFGDLPVQDAYGYNPRSEVVSARRTLADTPSQEVRGFSYDYAYDPIGNRLTSTEYDHENNMLVSSYTANALNQYEQRTVPGYVGVRGTATNTATVTVNGNPTWRLDDYFYGGDSADNSLTAIMKQLAITAVYNPPGTNNPDVVTSQTGRVFVAKTPEQFQYDDDGNLTQDGRFDYTWNGENRLIKAETRDGLPAAVPRVTVEYAYDHQGRMVLKQISTNTVIVSTRTLLWDGYNIVQALTHAHTHTLTNSFLWGLDLSGTLQGTGGVGGLLAEVQDGEPYFAAFDANGNVTEYNSANGTISAHYEYSPFGETVVQSGDLAASFSHRFSTKPWCGVAGLSEYEKRKYEPGMGRWRSRDPIVEFGGLNLYGFILNQTTCRNDKLGLFMCDLCCPDQCSKRKVRLRSAAVKILPTLWQPTGLDPSNIGYGAYNQVNIIVTAIGDGVSAGSAAGPIVGISAGAISLVIGELTPSAGDIAAGIAGAVKAGSLGDTGAKVWTRVVFNPCWLSQPCLFGICSRNEWGSDQGGNWRQCGIRADIYTVGGSDYSYSDYKTAQGAATECLAAHVALIEGRK